MPFGPAHPESAFQQWFDTIPSAIIAPLPSRQYALARLAQRSQSVRDLIPSNVNLCYLLHYVATEYGSPEQRITEIAARRQTEILRELGLPPHKRVVSMLQRGELESGQDVGQLYHGMEHMIRSEAFEDDYAIHWHIGIWPEDAPLVLCTDGLRDTLGDDQMQSLFHAEAS